jgi:hypothetical protein
MPLPIALLGEGGKVQGEDGKGIHRELHREQQQEEQQEQQQQEQQQQGAGRAGGRAAGGAMAVVVVVVVEEEEMVGVGSTAGRERRRKSRTTSGEGRRCTVRAREIGRGCTTWARARHPWYSRCISCRCEKPKPEAHLAGACSADSQCPVLYGIWHIRYPISACAIVPGISGLGQKPAVLTVPPCFFFCC